MSFMYGKIIKGPRTRIGFAMSISEIFIIGQAPGFSAENKR